MSVAGLTKKNIDFKWKALHQEAFDNIKRLEQEIVRKNEVIAELGGKAV